MRAVRRTRVAAAPESAEAAKREVVQATIRFALAETPGALCLAGFLYWLMATENGLSQDDRMMWLVGGVAVFVVYVGALFVTILLPALRRKAAFDKGVG